MQPIRTKTIVIRETGDTVTLPEASANALINSGQATPPKPKRAARRRKEPGSVLPNTKGQGADKPTEGPE